MNNGDYITGEVKKLQFGILSFKTDDMGTLQIEWVKIQHVISKDFFEVELQDSRVFFGSLDTTYSRRQMLIRGFTEDKSVFRDFVVTITPIKESFWDILDGSIKLGFNFTKGNQSGQFNLGGNTKYRTKNYNSEINLNSIISFQEQNETSRKQDLSFSLQRFLPGKWLVGGGLALEQNTELGINLRASITAGGGYNVVHSNNDLLFTVLGLSLNREMYLDSTEASFNLEGIASVQYQLFIYDHPKASLTTFLKVFPGLTDWGRVRANYDIVLSWEIIIDLYWDLSLYASYDNKPTGTASSTDYGTNTSFKFEF